MILLDIGPHPIWIVQTIPEWAKGAISTAYSNGWGEGFDDGTFKQISTLLVQRLRVFIARALGLPNKKKRSSTGKMQPKFYYGLVGHIATLVETGVIKEVSETHFPLA
ncbi:hypothetical protein [Paenibacillus taichungensis]|uniref:hypothetical protein n=1 Tax=Paenibacillus taichungensis TaxID=484184 RepID=UPI0035DE66C9